ncbi:chemotaxis protein CheA [Anaerotignum neopropionicum]|uniref:Chemotaxis protein CheA n=1 Tax=Anaerotignum neopropionicum TaxID=36847 RepID=A0A136WC50_9FIRM|nr:chemotaxis protein CheA [Anaerotignum neopropionicum]KXL52072.1 chemotaxis protein CheA [Anaerotignum neopropionicum]
MNNGMDSMIDMYLFETNSLLEQLENIMLEAEKAKAFTTEDIDEIFRIMHTIKGSSAMMEFDSISKIAHRVEDLFFIFRQNNTTNSFSDAMRTELFNLILNANDFMRTEVAKIEQNEPISDNIDSFISDINTFIEKLNSGEPNTLETAENKAKATPNTVTQNGTFVQSIPTTNAPYIIKIIFDDGCGMEHLRAFMVKNTIMDNIGNNFSFYPEDVETNSETCNYIMDNGFFIFLEDETLVDSAVAAIKSSLNIASFEVISNPSAQPEKHKIAATDSLQNGAANQNKAGKKASTPPAANQQTKQSIISVSLSKLDSLMAIVGEIVITESMVTSSPDLKGLKLDNFTKSTRQLRKLTDELQDIAMSMRMVPISGVFNKMNRIVRDMGQHLNKDVRLTIIGENTELDKTIVDSINDPLIHIVRNSMDHGIEESAAERIAAGKEPQGEIVLEAKHTGSDIIITIADDGVGVNPEKVLEKAKRNGILTKPENEYTQREILALLLAPGFSTNETVTEYSGRGVGMDVVKQNIEKVGGVVTIDSELGEGTCITLKIPLTLAIVDGMEIAVGKSTFTMPITNIKQSFKCNHDEVIFDSVGNELIERMGNYYPIVRLHNLYNIETSVTDIEEGILVWVEASDKSYCLFVDSFIGEQQVVVKPLPPYLNGFNIKNSGVAGCTILGDGNISIILDALSLHTAFMNSL